MVDDVPVINFAFSMDEGERMEWDVVPPDLGSSDLFFTEESYNKFSIESHLPEQIISKYKELGPPSYSDANDIPEFNLDKKSEASASQPASGSSSGVKNNGMKNSQGSIKTNVRDEMEKGSYPLPESVDGENTSDSVLEMPISYENSVKSVIPLSEEEQSQNSSYGRKRLKYPRYSSLSKCDQRFYVTKFLMYQKIRPEPNCPEYAKFLTLHDMVKKEQEEFTAYLQKASVEFKEDYSFLHEVAAEYMQKKHEATLKQLQKHSSCYLPVDKVPIITNHCTTHNLQPVEILLQMGEVPVSFPFLNKKMRTLLDYDILQQRFPTDRTHLPFYCHQVCSEDSNAQKLAQKYQCNIVVSSSVLKCLVDNHAPHFGKSWDIPVNVQEYQLEASEKVPHKVVFLDKPFHRQRTTRDINTTFHKFSLAARVLHPDHMSTYRYEQSSTLQSRSPSDDGSTNDFYSEESDIMDVSSLETFGTSTSTNWNLGNIAGNRVKSKRNSAEISSLKNKKSLVCERKDTKSLSKELFSRSVEVNLDIKPAGGNGHKNTPPQVSSISGLSGEKQAKGKSKTNTVSGSSSVNTLTGSCILEEKASEDEDSDSAPELVIHFESSDTDDTMSENKSIRGRAKASSKLPDTRRSKIAVTQVPSTPGSPTADMPGALMIDTPASPTPDAPASPTPETPASPIPEAPASPIPEAPASPTPDSPASPSLDAPASPTSDAPGSPLLSIQENLSQPFDKPMVIIPTESDVNVFEFDDIKPKPKTPIISDPGSSTDPENVSTSTKRNHHKAFGLGPLDSILEKQEELLKTTTRIKSANTGAKATTAIPEMNKSTPKQPYNNPPENKFHENPENYVKPEKGNNVSYCIWNFGDLRLLVRCKYSAIRKIKKTNTEFVYLIPKLEYQTEFGHEQTTLSEASQMWISSLIRHNCSINRIRINAFSSDIILEEMLSFHQISQLYNPVSANTFMYNLFQKLQSLNPGSYFLSHSAGENASVISQAMPENSHSQAFDLRKMYPEKIPIHIPKEIPWVPLDPNLLMQFHEFHGRIPCTFLPRDLKKQNAIPKMMKKKKKKKKKN